MSQIRIKALKGEGKTTSRKARKSGRASGTASPGGSDILHKVFHHDDAAYRSENEGTPPGTPPVGYEDDESLDGGQMTPDEREPQAFDPKKLVSELQDRKSNQNDTRQLLLEHYVQMLRNRYDGELEGANVSELLGTFIRSANRGSEAKERLLSLQAYILTACVSDMVTAESARTSLKQILTDDQDEDCQIQALYALTITVAYYGGGEDDVLDYMDFLVDAIQSNGDSIKSLNRDGLMVALFECWGFAATQVDDIWQQADYTMDAFVEKLDSTDVETQTIAAECIAFIFEASRAHEAEEGEPYELPYDPARVASRIKDMTKGAAKSMSRQNRRDLREGLRSVVTSLENSVGPYYSTAQGWTDGDVGYRFKLRKRYASSSYSYSALVETWHHYLRIAMLRNIFGNGLERHIENETAIVSESLDGLDWQLVRKTDTRASGGGMSSFEYALDGQ